MSQPELFPGRRDDGHRYTIEAATVRGRKHPHRSAALLPVMGLPYHLERAARIMRGLAESLRKCDALWHQEMCPDNDHPFTACPRRRFHDVHLYLEEACHETPTTPPPSPRSPSTNLS